MLAVRAPRGSERQEIEHIGSKQGQHAAAIFGALALYCFKTSLV